MAINRGTIPNFLTKQLKDIFGKTYDSYEPEYLKFLDKETSDKEREQYQEVTGLGRYSSTAEGAASQEDAIIQGYKTNLVNVKYAKHADVTLEAWEDNLYREILNIPKDMAEAAVETKETLGANLFNNGFSGSFLGADGVALFSTAHPDLVGGTYSNKATIGSSLSETSVNLDRVAIQSFTDARQLKKRFTLQLCIVPPALESQAQKLFQSALEPSTANNAINPFSREYGFIPKGYMVSHFLTSTVAYFYRTSAKGLVYQDRRPITFMESNEILNDMKRYYSNFRCAFGWYDPRSAYANQGL